MIVENYWWLQLGDKYWFQPPGGVRRQEARADAIALEGGQDSSWRILSPATHLVPSSSSHGSALLECLVHRPYHALQVCGSIDSSYHSITIYGGSVCS